MRKPKNTWAVSLLIFVLWIAIVIGGEMLTISGTTSLDDLVQSQIAPSLVIAPVFLLVIVALFRWWAPTGFTRFGGGRSLILLWLPVLCIGIMLAVGLPGNTLGSQALFFVLISSLLVGISEELMLRGIVLYGASTRYGLWPAIWISAVLFGLMHTLNVFLTGELGQAVIQAILAFGSGLMFLGLRLRMQNIVPAMLVHGFWDFSIFAATDHPLAAAAVGSLFPLLFAVYGLWLLRSYRHERTPIPAGPSALLPPQKTDPQA